MTLQGVRTSDICRTLWLDFRFDFFFRWVSASNFMLSRVEMNNKIEYPNNKFRNPNNFKEAPITPVSAFQEAVVKMPNEGSKKVRTYYIPPGQESSFFGRTMGTVSNTIQSMNPFKRTGGTRKTKRNKRSKQSKKSHKSQTIKRLHRRM
jgi:hypothetical protein